MPSLSALRAFSAFADAETMVAAGASLNVSHAAISQQIRALEGVLDLPLLDRSGRSPQLTAEGRQLAEALRQGFGEIARVIEELTGKGSEIPLQVSATPGFAASWLMPRLGGFREQHPGVDLMIDPSPEIKPLRPGGVEAALRYGDGGWAGLDVHLLLPSPIVVVAAPELIGDRRPRCAEDLLQFHWLQEAGTNEASAWFAQRGVEGRSTKGSMSLPGNLLLEAARQGQGVAITSRVLVQQELEAGRLLLLFEEASSRGYYLVTRPGVQRPALRNFCRWIKAEAQNETRNETRKDIPNAAP